MKVRKQNKTKIGSSCGLNRKRDLNVLEACTESNLTLTHQNFLGQHCVGSPSPTALQERESTTQRFPGNLLV